MYGGADNDTIFAGDGDDVVLAGTGDDTLNGDAGNDRLYANAGTNTLYGGAGDDTYYGGSGVDTYQFNAADGAAVERVSFFEATDIIQLNGFGFADATAAAASFTQAGGNVIFSAGGVTIAFYGASLADVQAAVQVDGLAELPSVDKQIVSEAPSLPQDAVADVLATQAQDNAYAVSFDTLEDIGYHTELFYLDFQSLL
ncbi:MAG TPA: hypothetical protein ENJ42_07890 [Hellea balneolensis]|uniref:Calcium-binding protein n=1 Tax=Hellea balneolensis TaxID=287478 RepID=A0A7C5QWW2_9PROT|nr:hypothetical protein [Hellea balneolensis]